MKFDNIFRLIYNCRTKMYFFGLKMQFIWTKNVRLNIRNVGLNWFLSDLIVFRRTNLHFVGLIVN
jgi:hypothetical protein